MISWEEFKKVEHSRSARKKYLFKDGRIFHVLLSQQFNREDLETIYQTATAIRRLDKFQPAFLRYSLFGKRALNLFAQPSTRTVESFAAAEDVLGMTTRVVQDLNTSSFAKGETVEDSIRTLSSYFHAVVTRHKDDSFPMHAAWATSNSKRPVPIISGGSGSSQHVTQSLLDIYTLRYSFKDTGGIDGKRIAIISDLKRNRAARSLIYLLTKFEGIEFVLISPDTMQIENNLREYIEKNHNLKIYDYSNVKEALKDQGKKLDTIYITRNQKEYKDNLGASALNWNEEDYFLRWEYRNLIREDCVIMHPLPRVNELPIEWDDFPGSVVWRQPRNGMWVRAALFAIIFNVDQSIRAKFEDLSQMGGY